MTPAALVLAQRKCAVLARRIATLRRAALRTTTPLLIEDDQRELDGLIATIERACDDADVLARKQRAAIGLALATTGVAPIRRTRPRSG